MINEVDTRNYRACVFVTKALKDACVEKVRDMLVALTMGRILRYSQCDTEKPGFPFAPHDRWVLSIDEWMVTGETVEDAECKMLGLILRDGIGFPLFRRVVCAAYPSKEER